MGSIVMSMSGIVWKEIHTRLLGGGLNLIRAWPSSFLKTTARTRLTSRALKRVPRSMRAVAAISRRKFPLYLKSASAQQSPSTVRSLSLGFVMHGAPSPISTFRRTIPERNAGFLTRAIFFVIFFLMKSSICSVL